MADREILNAFVDGGELVQLFRKPEDGKVYAARRPAEYASFLRRADVTPEVERTLRSSSVVRGIKIEGQHLRVSWLSAEARRGWSQHEDSPLVLAGVESL
jgi:hypothetical protein